MINDLNIASSKQATNNMITDSIDKLSAYVATHFQTEEDLMKATSYPDYNAHKQEHNNLKEQAN